MADTRAMGSTNPVKSGKDKDKEKDKDRNKKSGRKKNDNMSTDNLEISEPENDKTASNRDTTLTTKPSGSAFTPSSSATTVNFNNNTEPAAELQRESDGDASSNEDDNDDTGEDDDQLSGDAPKIDADVAGNGPPVDDDTYKMMREKQMGAAVMFVPILQPKWRKGPVSQRPLNSRHAKQLAARMKHKVRRTELSDRLRVSMTRKEYDACIKYTSKKYTEWHKEGTTTTKYTPEELRKALKACIMSPIPIKDAPMLLWDPDLKTQPQLDTGQHRRAAFLLAFNANGESKELTPETVLQIGWVVDIADMDALDDKYYLLIRANQHDVYAPDSQGDIFMQLNSIFDDFRAKENPRGKREGARLDRFVEFIKEELGREVIESKRYLSLLSNPTWRAQAALYVSFAFGRQSFKVHHFTLASGQFMDEFWIAHLNTQYSKMAGAFGDDCKKKLRIEDIDAIRQVKIPNKHQETLRVLFFPCAGDDAKGTFGVNPSWFINSEYAGLQFLVPYNHNQRGPYKHRRPNFLEVLNEVEYCNIFERLLEFDYEIPDPHVLIKEIKIVGSTLTALIRHMIFWADDSWTPPKNNQEDLRANLSYIRLLQDRYTPPTDDNMVMMDSNTMAAINEQKKLARVKVLNAVGALQVYVHDQSKAWREVPKTKLLLRKDFPATRLSQTQRREYRDTFVFQPWSGFLTLMIFYLGTSAFRGVMNPWKKNRFFHDKKSTLAPMVDQITTFYKPHGTRRLQYLLVNKHPYKHTERVVAAVEKAILVEEMRTAAMIKRDFERVWEQRELFAAEYEEANGRQPGEIVLSEDNDGTKGTAVLELGKPLEEVGEIISGVLKDEALLLRDFNLVYSQAELDNNSVLKKLPPEAEIDPKRKLGAVNDSSDYEGPLPRLPPSSTKKPGSRKRGSVVDADTTPTKKTKKSKPGPGIGKGGTKRPAKSSR